MGKSIVIVGADFSNSAAFTDLTDKFSFTDGFVMVAVQSGANSPGDVNSSSAASIGNYVDISQYRGKKIVFSGISWRSSGGARTPWGGLFFTQNAAWNVSNGTCLSSPVTWYEDSGTPSDGQVVEYEMVIPNTAVYFRCDWFNTANALSRNAKFYCYIK